MSIRERLQEQSDGGIFTNKDLVRSETIIDEDRIVGRDQQLDRVIENLRPALRREGLPNMLLNGPSGTGKSLIINAVCNQVADLCESKDIRFGKITLNCESSKSLDRAVYRLVKSAAENAGTEIGVPEKGISTDKKFDRLFQIVDTHYEVVVFVLDEIDQLQGPYDDKAHSSLLYQLSRAEKMRNINTCVSVVGLTNYTNFIEDMGTRANSSFNPDDIFFDDYDADQLRAILKKRRDAFREDVLRSEVIPLIAAFGSQTHGDARKAIDLFRWAGEIAERNNDSVVTEAHARAGQEKYDQNRTLRHISGLATQKKISLYATAAVEYYSSSDLHPIPAGAGWEVYKHLTQAIDAETYSRETYVNHVSEQETYGVLDAERRGRGRGRGVQMFFTLDESANDILETIEANSRLGEHQFNSDMLRNIVASNLD